MNGLSWVEALRPTNWPVFAMMSARVVGLIMVAPLWSMVVIPAKLRGAMAIVLTFAMMPLAPKVSIDIAVPSLFIPIASELLLGVAIGLSAAVMMYAVTVAAEVLSLQMGLSLGAALGGMTDTGTPGIGQFYGQFTLAAYVLTGGHLALLVSLARSFQEIPAGHPLDMENGGHAVLALTGSVFDVAVRVAAPVLVALLVSNIALALLNRAVPQLNTMMVAVPITVAVGLVAIGVTLPLTGQLLMQWAGGIGSASDAVVHAFTLPSVP